MDGSYLTQLEKVETALEENNGVFSDVIIEQFVKVVTEMKGNGISAKEYCSCFFESMKKSITEKGSTTVLFVCCRYSIICKAAAAGIASMN